ncbi:MAG: DUF3568 family protein [Candidatus Omnitrophota bacterium]|nr:DUF3568 family protein [Candidatus Omnitrophota bacterium]
MFKKIAVSIFSVFLLVNICGCAALIVGGVAGGAGTAVWLSGKLVQYVNHPLEQTTKAAKDYLQFRNLTIVSKETIASGHSVVQIRGREASGERIRIDIHKITENRSRIEVHVGTLISNKEAGDRILKGITERL